MAKEQKESRPWVTFPGAGWVRYVWLLYSAFFFIEPIKRNQAGYWLEFVVAYVIFLGLYFYINVLRGNLQLILIGAMYVEGLLYVPQNGSAIGIFIYVAAFLPFCIESNPIVLALFGGGTLLIALEAWLLHFSPWAWMPMVFVTLVVGVSNMAFAQGKRASAKLRIAREEVEHLAKLAERERISRDLHDVLGHTLSVIVLKTELAGRLMERDPKRSAQEIADVEQIARKALAEVREAIGGYRAEGLAAEIERAHRTLDAAGVRLSCTSAPPKLNPTEETVLSLIVREAVTNIVRHAHATSAMLTFDSKAGRRAMVVEDDGRGGLRKEGNGLRGMRERIEALGGSFSLEAERGTRLMIELPVTEGKAGSNDC
jgi:two-component system, NarL family, sensor histidine kinase DesK